MLKELMLKVDFIFNDEKGKRIVGGAEPNYSTDDLRWLDFNGKEIMIQTSKGDMFFIVKKIDVFSSISGAINIGLTLDADTQFDAINIGDKVFKISNIGNGYKLAIKDKGTFYAVTDSEIMQAEIDMQMQLPVELVRFYKEIGYGFFKSVKGNINRLMDPLSIRDFRLRQNDFEYFPDMEIYAEFEKNKLIFFEVNESVFFSIELCDGDRQRILLYNVVIAESLEAFVEAFLDNEDFYEEIFL